MSTADSIYDEVIDFFARGSTSAQVLQFRPSAAAQERVRYLLERNRSGELSQDETAELDQLAAVEHLMRMIKARARMYAQSDSRT